jgi:hypothetical protein
MANLKIKIPHELNQEEAQKRIKKLLSETKEDHGDKISNLHERWDNNVGTFSFTTYGFDLSGTLTVNKSSVDLDADVPFAVMIFKDKIKNLIQEKAAELLA